MSPAGIIAVGRAPIAPADRRAALEYLLDAAHVLDYSEGGGSEASRWAELVASRAVLHLRALDRGLVDTGLDRWIDQTLRAFAAYGIEIGGSS